MATDDRIAAAEAAKGLGNDAYNLKNFDEAIKHYSEAIKLNPDNAVYYSNRSVCFAAKKDWKTSLEDALSCVSKDHTFMKGYLRLATAQIELHMYEDAEATLLKLGDDNDQVPKLKRLIRTKKQAMATKKPVKTLDEAQKKEFFEMQEQLGTYNKELKNLGMRLNSSQRDMKVNQTTAGHIASLTDAVPLYRAVGKAFILTPKSNLESRFEDTHANHIKNIRNLMDQRDYYERRISSTTQNMRDMTAGM